VLPAAAALAALALLAACQPTPPSRAPLPPVAAAADLDGDGVLSADEWDAAGDALYDALDADRSGDLTYAEIRAGEARLRAADDPPLDPALLERWAVRTDRDGDGRVTRAEWAAARREIFADADRDRNRFVTTGPVDEASRVVLIRF
jgi:hypothetical protein